MFGGTGLVGRHLVEALAGAPHVHHVHAPVRRRSDLADGRPRIDAPVVDFSDLGASTRALTCDLVFLCLGTTMKRAGSKEAFEAVDHDLTLAAAHVALDGGAHHAFLVSSVGADPDSKVFYLRIKGRTEAALAALPFTSVHVFRPAILTGPRTESRPAERVGIALGRLLTPLMVGPLRRQRPIAARTVARAMVAASVAPGRGLTVHESEEMATHEG